MKRATSHSAKASTSSRVKQFGSSWSKRHHTILRKTPYSTALKRKIYTPIDTPKRKQTRKQVRFKEVEQVCSGLLKKTWVCHSCTPLFRFHTDAASLRRYSQNLSAFVAVRLKKGLAASVGEDADVSATIEIIEGLAMTEEPDALKIELKDKKEKIISEMVLCSVNITNELDGIFTSSDPYRRQRTSSRRSRTKQFLTLPVLLCTGLVTPRAATIAWLQENFDCDVKPMKFSPIELAWMVSMWTSIPYNSEKRKSGFSTEFVWKIPVEGLGLEKIEYQMESKSVKAIWDSIERDQTDEITLEHVQKFIRAILSHLFYIFHIRFDALPLVQIAAPFVQVRNLGKIKICSPEYVHTVLAHLSSIAAERLAWT